MSRIVKNPEERRLEIIDIAEELFSEKGYDETAVSDIVKRADVAQGTFYYYFGSKAEVLDAIIDRILDEIGRKTRELSVMDHMDAVERMLAFFGVFRTVGEGREKLMEYLHEERNALLHLKLEKKVYPMIIPPFAGIIRQGVEEGLFDTKYPEEAARVILVSFTALTGDSNAGGEGIAGKDGEDAVGKDDYAKAHEIDPEMYPVVFDLFDRILGARPGTFMEYTSRMMEEGK
jgi:AcrR family transcriptional regulator